MPPAPIAPAAATWPARPAKRHVAAPSRRPTRNSRPCLYPSTRRVPMSPRRAVTNSTVARRLETTSRCKSSASRATNRGNPSGSLPTSKPSAFSDATALARARRVPRNLRLASTPAVSLSATLAVPNTPSSRLVLSPVALYRAASMETDGRKSCNSREWKNKTSAALANDAANRKL
ncbi:hypothetical protein C8F04DRAFT_1240910, partial [Mycena alexandri]